MSGGKGNLQCSLSSEKVRHLTKGKKTGLLVFGYSTLKMSIVFSVLSVTQLYINVIELHIFISATLQLQRFLVLAVIIIRNSGSKETRFFPITYFQAEMNCYLTVCQTQQSAQHLISHLLPSFLQSCCLPKEINFHSVLR